MNNVLKIKKWHTNNNKNNNVSITKYTLKNLK